MVSIFQRDSKLMKIMTWISDMVHTQLLWVIFTLVGLVVGGVFPATYSLFSVHRKLIQKSDGISKSKYFWKEYKENFIKSNIIGYSTILLTVISIYHLQFSQNIQNNFFYISIIVSFGLILIILLLSLYVWPVATHFKLGIFDLFKHAFIIEISFPIHTIGVLISTIIFIWSTSAVPVLVPFFSISAYTYFIMKIANHAFLSVEKSENIE